MLMLLPLLLLTLHACRRIRFWQRMGMPLAARRRYRIASAGLGGLILTAMAMQELLLLKAGLLTWQTGLPLHLCSLMGLLTLPMLWTRQPLLLNVSFFAGIPGAALALVFPAVVDTPWPRITALAFDALHAGLVCAPLLPMAMGWRPEPGGAHGAWWTLLLAACVVSFVNGVTGANYLFLAGPVDGTPLVFLARWGSRVYRLLLMMLTTLVLTAEAALLHLLQRLRLQGRGVPMP